MFQKETPIQAANGPGPFRGGGVAYRRKPRRRTVLRCVSLDGLVPLNCAEAGARRGTLCVGGAAPPGLRDG